MQRRHQQGGGERVDQPDRDRHKAHDQQHGGSGAGVGVAAQPACRRATRQQPDHQRPHDQERHHDRHPGRRQDRDPGSAQRDRPRLNRSRWVSCDRPEQPCGEHHRPADRERQRAREHPHDPPPQRTAAAPCPGHPIDGGHQHRHDQREHEQGDRPSRDNLAVQDQVRRGGRHGRTAVQCADRLQHDSPHLGDHRRALDGILCSRTALTRQRQQHRGNAAGPERTLL